jgi:hypothetical protein
MDVNYKVYFFLRLSLINKINQAYSYPSIMFLKKLYTEKRSSYTF